MAPRPTDAATPPARQVGIVDDDPAVRESLRFLLDVSGYPAATFESAEEFLAHPEHASLAGLILDHHMPLVTGLELVARLRAVGDRMPVLLITGSPTPAIVARAAALGVERVVDKPPSEADLLRFVAAVVG